jgi:hypothetical protein
LKRTLSLLLIALPLLAFDWRLSNTNHLIGDRDHTVDYNRLRLEGRANLSDRFTLHGTVDNEPLTGRTYRQSEAFQTARSALTPLFFDPYYTTYESQTHLNRLYLYRLYGTYEMDRATLHAGFLRIPFGVGRIWTPTDQFNPLNIHSIETGERLGVSALHGVIYTGDLSQLELIGTIGADRRLDKSGLLYKAPLLGSHSGISLIKTPAFKMAGAQSEWHIGQSGALGRFEGGWFFDRPGGEPAYFRGLIGLDHGFRDGLSMAIEALYDSGQSRDRSRYLGARLDYPVNMLFGLSAASVLNLGDQSLFVNLSGRYSLGQRSDLGFGVMGFEGDKASEYGSQPTRLYLSLSHFF